MGVDPQTYAIWRSTRLGSITEELEQRLVFDLAGPLEGRRVLDVGCGDGAYAVLAAARGGIVTAIDSSEDMLAAARRGAERVGRPISFVTADAERLPFAGQSFDVIFAISVLCFVRDPTRALSEIARVLVPGGRLVLGDLGRRSAWAVWRRLRGLLGSPTWRAVRFRTPRELRDLVEAAGLRVEQVRGTVFHPPMGLAARALVPIDATLGRITSWGAAFLALSAVKGESSS